MGIVIDISDVHPSNEPVPIVVTVVGILTDSSDVQLKNAAPLILVTVEAKVMTG